MGKGKKNMFDCLEIFYNYGVSTSCDHLCPISYLFSTVLRSGGTREYQKKMELNYQAGLRAA